MRRTPSGPIDRLHHDMIFDTALDFALRSRSLALLVPGLLDGDAERSRCTAGPTASGCGRDQSGSSSMLSFSESATGIACEHG